METNQIIGYLGIWSTIGAVLFSGIVVYLFRSGIVYESRSQDGLRKRDTSAKGWTSTLAFVGFIVVFLLASNYLNIIKAAPAASFWEVFWLNFALMMILVVYDSVVIDWLVIVLWRPPFLRLPEEMNAASMKKHILFTIPVAPVICLIISGISAGLTVLMW